MNPIFKINFEEITFWKFWKLFLDLEVALDFQARTNQIDCFFKLFWDPLYICMYVGLYDYMLNIISLINKYVWCFSIVNEVGIFLLFPVSDIKYKNISISVDLSTQQKIHFLNFIWIDLWKKSKWHKCIIPQLRPFAFPSVFKRYIKFLNSIHANTAIVV